MKVLASLALAASVIGLLTGCDDDDGGGSTGPPVDTELSVTASALSPTSGAAPLVVLLTGSSNAAALGRTVVEWKWDYEDDGVFDFTSQGSPATSFAYTQSGAYLARLEATDDTGAQESSTLAIEVLAPLAVEVTATPPSGQWPLTVRLSPSASSSGPSVATYRWDFDGDGMFDTGTIVKPDPQYYTYTAGGTYTATVEVADEVGNTATGSVDVVITNPLPSATVTLNPSNGPVPLDVVINVAASSPNGPITDVTIDPGDGSAPILLPGPGTANHTYTGAGEFGMSVVVTDEAGETITLQSPLVNVDVGAPGSPTAEVTASVSSGNAPLAVAFNASGSSTPQGSITKYEWDFDYDGETFDVDLDSGDTSTASVTYENAGTKYIGVRVTNSSGLSSLGVTSVLVNLDVTLVVLDDTVNPTDMEMDGATTTVRTTVSANTEVRVEIRDRANIVVRTLFDGPRTAGTYEDEWDGRGQGGEILPDGDYYAWIAYALDGLPAEEPDEPSGGAFGFVTGTENLSNGATFDPWSDEFWEMTFDMAGVGAAEVTLWITPFGNGAIEATVLTAEPYGSGQYTAYWAGVTDDGNYVAPQSSSPGSGGDYLWSAQAFTLPDNVIIVEGGSPQITDLEVRANAGDDPNVFDPTQTECEGVPNCEILVTVDRDSELNVAIYNLETGGLVRFLTVPDAIGGTNSIVWDGSALPGTLVAPGRYRLEITANNEGGTTPLRRALVVVRY